MLVSVLVYIVVTWIGKDTLKENLERKKRLKEEKRMRKDVREKKLNGGIFENEPKEDEGDVPDESEKPLKSDLSV